MIAADGSFYVTGGTLRQDSPSYVERQADYALYEGLTRGEFCYILTSRQMGKSSLMVRTARRLRQEGVAVAVLDLTALGRNVTVEQWYDGLLRRIGEQLDREDELEAFWFAQERLSPLQRFMAALRQVVLRANGSRQTGDGSPTRTGPADVADGISTADYRRPSAVSRVVIFVDEIDAVRSLPFSTDEFFAAVRECYNRRTEDPEFERLTFCLLGVATPSDLIQDTRTTPFNIGRRIELTDFSAAEAAPLARGLGRGEPAGAALVRRVLYWTGGHPYLTQRLCQAVAQDGSVTSPAGVDRLCEGLFLSASAREKDDNLLFVRERLLKNEVERAGLLDLYGQVRAGKRVALDDTSQMVSVLRLSGITRVEAGCLRVRNRIYERVFDREWVTRHMPDAELRRQQAAYRRGLWRATAVAAAVVTVVAGLAVIARTQANRADQARRRAVQQRWTSEWQRLEARRNLYAAQMNLAQQSWEAGDPARAQGLLEALRPEPDQEDMRGFEWRYLWRLCHRNSRLSSRAETGPVTQVAFSPNGRILAVSTGDVVKLREAATGREIASLGGHKGEIVSIAFSPDGRTLASGGDDRLVRLWDVKARRLIVALPGHSDRVHAVAFSPGGGILASGSDDRTIRLWDVASTRSAANRPPKVGQWNIAILPGYTANWHSLAFSPDSKILAAGTREGVVQLWDLPSRRRAATVEARPRALARSNVSTWIDCLAFSPDGRLLAAAGRDSDIELWDVAGYPPKVGGREACTLWGHANNILSVAFSPDGKTVASGSDDSTVQLWDLRMKQEIGTLCGHEGAVTSVAFSPDGKTVASGSADHTVKLWDVASLREIVLPPRTSGKRTGSTVGLVDRPAEPPARDAVRDRPFLRLRLPATAVAFSADSRILATGSGDGSVTLWEVASGRREALLQGHHGSVRCVVFSPDGRSLAVGCGDETATLWAAGPWPWAVASARTSLPLRPAHSPQPIAWKEVATLHGYAPWDVPGASTIAFSPDSRLLAMGCVDQTVQLWEVTGPHKLASLGGLTRAVCGVAFSPDGTLLTAGTAAATERLRFWQIQPPAAGPGSGQPEKRPGVFWQETASPSDVEHSGPFFFSPDGKMLITGGVYGSVKLSDLDIRRTVAMLNAPLEKGGTFVLSPDGKTLAVNRGNTIRLWSLPARREVAALKGHTGPVYAMAFSPTGNLLASTAGDGTVRLWRAVPFQETDSLRMRFAAVGSRQVTLQWQPLSWAVGYNVYRRSGVQAFGRSGVQERPMSGPERLNARTPDRSTGFVKLNRQLVSGPSYTDGGPGLVDGEPQTYAVAAVYRGPAGKLGEGPRVQLQATPGSVPPGFLGCSIDEPPDLSGSVRFEAATGAITMRGSGDMVWGTADSFYFLSRPVSGDFQITATQLTLPTETNILARAGLMVRESLEPGARNTYLFTTPERGLIEQWRPAPNNPTESMGVIQDVHRPTVLRLPIVLRLTRRGNQVVSEYSQDRGRTFRPADEPLQFQPALADRVYVGLAISANLTNGNAGGRITEAKFSGLELRLLSR